MWRPLSVADQLDFFLSILNHEGSIAKILVKGAFISTGTAVSVLAAKDTAGTIYLFAVGVEVRQRFVEHRTNSVRNAASHGIAINS